jgi:hypothetical protein
MSPSSKAPNKKPVPIEKSNSTNPFLQEADDEVDTGKKSPAAAAGNQKKSSLPRPSPPRQTKIISARSVESVPITVNSHIPAGTTPHYFRHKVPVPVTTGVTNEIGTQVETPKSASEENLALFAPTNKLLTTSESSDPICVSIGGGEQFQEKKNENHTNGRHHSRYNPVFDVL